MCILTIQQVAYIISHRCRDLGDVDRVGSTLAQCVLQGCDTGSSEVDRAAMGARARLTFKPDCYSILGVYSENPYGLRPNAMHADLAKILMNRALAIGKV